MTPSNNNNGNPLILRILDSLGIAHQVAPVQHTHSQSEVDGLETALAGKASSSEMTTALAGKMDKMTVDEEPTSGSNNLVKSGGVFSALLNKVYRLIAPYSTSEKWAYVETEIDGDDGIIHLGVKSEGEDDQVVDIDHNNIANLQRALTNPDSAPTDNSTNLVTSGGVKAALDNLRNFVHRLFFENPANHAKAVVYVGTDENGDESAIYLYLKTSGGAEYEQYITKDNFVNLVRALANPSTIIPEGTSSKLITSGAVYNAVSNKLYWEEIHGVTFTGIGGSGRMVLMDSVPSDFHAGDVIRFKKSNLSGCYTGIVTGTDYGIKCLYVSPNIYVDDSIITEGTVSILRP